LTDLRSGIDSISKESFCAYHLSSSLSNFLFFSRRSASAASLILSSRSFDFMSLLYRMKLSSAREMAIRIDNTFNA